MTLTRIKKTTTTKKYIQAKREVCNGSSNGTLSVGFKNTIHKAQCIYEIVPSNEAYSICTLFLFHQERLIL